VPITWIERVAQAPAATERVSQLPAWSERETPAPADTSPILMLPWMPMEIPAPGTSMWIEREKPVWRPF